MLSIRIYKMRTINTLTTLFDGHVQMNYIFLLIVVVGGGGRGCGGDGVNFKREHNQRIDN